MGQDTVMDFVTKQVAVQTLTGAAVTTLLATWLNGEALELATLMSNSISVGAPAACGMLGANLVYTEQGARPDLIRGLLAGSITLSLLLVSGSIPYVFDSKTLMLVATVGAGTMAGDYLGEMLVPK